jgi:hypothetical protein
VNGSAVPELLSKGEYARLIGVTPGRVSQYISEGKLSGEALKGEGRTAQIRVAVANQQLNLRLDISQRLGNGINTRLDQGPRPAAADALPLAAPPAGDSVEEQIKRARLRQIELDNRKSAEDAALRAGKLIDAEAVRQSQGRAFARLVAGFEGSLADFATAIANKFSLQQRDVLHELKMEWRNVRARNAKDLQTAAEQLPQESQIELEDGAAIDEAEPVPEDAAA